MSGPGSYWMGAEEEREVLDVLASGHVFRYGDLEDPAYKHKVYSFEQALAQYCHTQHALATTSGTAVLHIYATAAHDFGVRPSDHPCATWTQACAAWLRYQGFLKQPPQTP